MWGIYKVAKNNWIRSIILFIGVIFLFSLSGLSKILTDYLWFDALGFSQIFLTIFKSKILLFFIGSSIFLLFAGSNIWIASRFSKKEKGFISSKFIRLFLLIFSLIMGLIASSKWMVILQYINQLPFNLKDPIFLKDVSFYMFSLPFFLSLWGFFIGCVIFTGILMLIYYLPSIKIGFSEPDIHTGQIPENQFNIKKTFTK